MVEADRQLPNQWLLWAHHEKSSNVDGRSERKFTVRSFPTASVQLTNTMGKENNT